MAKKQRFGSTMKETPFQMRSGNNPSPHKFFRGLGRAFRSLLFGARKRRGGTSSNPGRQARGMHTYYAGNAPSSVTASGPATSPSGTVPSTTTAQTTATTNPNPRQPRKAQDSYS